MNLTLWQIEGALAGLMEAREDALANLNDAEMSFPGDPAGKADLIADRSRELTEIDNAIAEAVKAEVKKVDNIRGLWKHLQMLRDAAKSEAEAMATRAKALDRQLTVLKSAVQVTMEEMPWVEGKSRKLEGKTGTLYLKGNGGKEPVVITDESLIPDSECRFTCTFIGSAAPALLTHLQVLSQGVLDITLNREPSMSRIAETLAKNCEKCRGDGIESSDRECPTCKTFGTVYCLQRGEHQVSGNSSACQACGGTGKQGVPGAVLGTRGSHVEVR